MLFDQERESVDEAVKRADTVMYEFRQMRWAEQAGQKGNPAV